MLTLLACFGFTWNTYILPQPNLLLYYLNIVSSSYPVILVVCLKHLIELYLVYDHVASASWLDRP